MNRRGFLAGLLTLPLADPTYRLLIEFDRKHEQAAVLSALADYRVILTSRVDNQKLKWMVAIQTKLTRFRLRDQLRQLPGVRNVWLR